MLMGRVLNQEYIHRMLILVFNTDDEWSNNLPSILSHWHILQMNTLKLGYNADIH